VPKFCCIGRGEPAKDQGWGRRQDERKMLASRENDASGGGGGGRESLRWSEGAGVDEQLKRGRKNGGNNVTRLDALSPTPWTADGCTAEFRAPPDALSPDS